MSLRSFEQFPAIDVAHVAPGVPALAQRVNVDRAEGYHILERFVRRSLVAGDGHARLHNILTRQHHDRTFEALTPDVAGESHLSRRIRNAKARDLDRTDNA